MHTAKYDDVTLLKQKC